MPTKHRNAKSKAVGAKRIARGAVLVRYGAVAETKGIDMMSLCGTITMTVDPIAYQRESRGDA